MRRQRARTQQHGQLVRALEIHGSRDLPGSARNGRPDHRGRDHLVVQDDRKGLTDIGRRIGAELARAGRVEGKINGGLAVRIRSRHRIGQFLAGDDGAFLQRVIDAFLIGRGQDDLAHARPRLRIGAGGDDRIEGQLGRGADQRLEFLGRADARHLDQDAVGALADNGRFACADLVHAASDDFDALLDGAVVGHGLFGVRQLDGDRIARLLDRQALLAGAGQGRDGRGSQDHDFGGAGDPVGVLDLDLQGAFGGRQAADRAQGRAFVSQGAAQFGPQRVHARLVNLGHAHLSQKMGAAAQIQAKRHDGTGQPAGPGIARGGKLGRLDAVALDLGQGVVMGFDPLIEQVWHGKADAQDAKPDDQDAFPTVDLKHLCRSP